MTVSLKDIQAAHDRIGDGVYRTPCRESVSLSELCGCRVFCKMDNLQRTGSFKERGARNALLQLSGAQRRAGVIAASAGNHALGLACHGRLLKIPVTVVMPATAPLIKVATCRQLGARVVLHGDDFSAARAHADEIAAAQGLAYVHGFDDPAIIAGQGTMALEILEQVPGVQAIVVPVGGGGLLAGTVIAVKNLRPQVAVIGVEAQHCAAFSAANARGGPQAIKMAPTLADGLAVGKVGELAYRLARGGVDRLVQVDEANLALAVFRLMEREKSVVEGAAAAPLAACLSGKLPELAGQQVVLAVCGGNIDLSTLDRIIEHGLVHDGRLCRFTAVISDRPGGLAALAGLIASTGASVKQITHDRAFSGPDVAAVRAVCVVETTDRDHIDQLLGVIRGAGITVTAEV